jgi:hypothetical protein
VRAIAAVLTCVLFLSEVATASPAPELVDFFSFEQDFEGWTTDGIGQMLRVVVVDDTTAAASEAFPLTATN